MILEDNLAGVVDRRFHGGKLDQHLRAVLSVFHHLPYRLQMSDCAGQAVQDSLCIFVLMFHRYTSISPMGGYGHYIVSSVPSQGALKKNIRNFFVKWHENLVIFPKSFAIIQYILMYTLKGGALI